MKKNKMTFDELANQAELLNDTEQSRILGGREGRDGVYSWSSSRGGLIDDEVIIRLNNIKLRGS